MQKIAIGTEKGGYFLERNGGWRVDGPRFPGWKVSAYGRAPDGAYLVGLGSNWFGASVHRSEDFDKWEQVDSGPTYPGELNRKLTQIWTFHTAGDRVFAGVDEAGLFMSEDQGITWNPVAGLNEHESRPIWEPGFGGLCAHHILTDGNRIWVGISAVGVFRSDDGGKTFGRFDEGVTPAGTPDKEGEGANSWCVHGLAADPEHPDSIWRQDHMGVYRTTNGGEAWTRIETGLPSAFGFTMRRHHASGTLFVVPIEASDNRVPVGGHLAAYRSTDNGDSWNVSGTGWPRAEQFTGVLRNAMDVDADGGVAFGTTGGQVYVSDDVGEHWEQLPFSFPRILTVALI